MASWMSALGEVAEDRRRRLQRPVPHARVALLRADMEREAVGDEAERMGALEHARRHLRRAAELARQRPFRARAVAQDPAEHLRAGRGARDLFDLGLAIDGEEADAERVGARDVLLLLDRVAEADAVGRRAGGQTPARSRSARRCRSTSRGRRADRESPAPDSPSRRRRRACRAARWRSRDNSRARRRDRRRGAGPSSRLRARKSLMRSVIAASPNARKPPRLET